MYWQAFLVFYWASFFVLVVYVQINVLTALIIDAFGVVHERRTMDKEQVRGAR